MKTKHCKVCKETKETSNFYKNSTYKDGLMSKCKDCQKAATTAWAKSNPTAVKKIRDKFYQNNKPMYAELAKAARKKKPEMFNALNAAYRGRKLQAQPSWLTKEQKDQVCSFYAHAKECELLTGDKYHVDHIIPLQGKNVCGLHVPWNLQVLPADVNLSKSNKLDDAAIYSQGLARTS